MPEQITLVDENDQVTGSAEKMEVHEKGLLHRAFSIIIFNKNKEMMIQKRASTKYHCGGMWTNTCCGHPLANEELETAANRRLQQEMGIQTKLHDIGKFHYTTTFNNGLTENEIDHVLVGEYNENPNPDPNEADDWKWITLENLKSAMAKNPEQFTFWFHEIIKKSPTFQQGF